MSASDELTTQALTSQDTDTLSDERLARLFEETKTIAVIGASTSSNKPAHGVPLYMQRHGYRVLPVNPNATGQELFGEAVTATLVDLELPVDVVDVFRRSEDVPGHLSDILAMKPLPKVVWLQLGIRNDEVANELRAAGIEVVQDRCIKVEHARLRSQSSHEPSNEFSKQSSSQSGE